MHWIVQENIYAEEGFDRLMAALGRLELPHSVHKVVPFTGEIMPDATPTPGPVIVMGYPVKPETGVSAVEPQQGVAR